MPKKSNITKTKLINLIAEENRIHPKDVHALIQSFLNKITKHLIEGGRIEFRDFGIFEVVERKQKVGRNPKKAELTIVIPSCNVVKFTPGKKLKDLIHLLNSTL